MGRITKKLRRHSVIRSILPTLVLLVAVIVAAMFASFRVEQNTEESCFTRLEETVEQGANDIKSLIQSDEQIMITISSMLADHATLNEENCESYLSSVKSGNLITSYSVLLANGNMVYGNASVSFSDYPEYEYEGDQSVHLSERFTDTSGNPYVAFIEPIEKDGETLGYLYGYVNLKLTPSKLLFTAFDNQAQLYIIDGNTGDFLVDTWHDSLGNINDSNFKSRKLKQGLNFEQVKKHIENAQPGFTVFVSETTGDDFYTYFCPIGLYNLSFQVTVSKSVVYETASEVQKTIYMLCAFLIAALLTYFIYLIVFTRGQLKQRQLETSRSSAISDVQQMLFNAYREPDVINLALKKTMEFLDAESIRFLIMAPDKIDTDYCYPESAKTNVDLANYEEKEQTLFTSHKVGERSVAFDSSELADLNEVKKLFSIEKPLGSFIASKVFNPSTGYEGILYVTNTTKPDDCVAILDMLVAAFQMAVRSVGSYKSLKQIGERDFLTKLKNRNAYQKEAASYGTKPGDFACIYIDANGLHDLNNNFGHAAGDEMLRSVGAYIIELFGSENSYRIGGDEFVVFCEGISKADIEKDIQTLRTMLSAKEYFVSVGLAFRENNQKLQTMLKSAEERMYEDKSKFYQGSHDRRRARRRNEELESILTQKNDQDTFLSAISAEFLGVYIVNLDTNLTRAIYKLEHFDEILEKHEFVYSDSLSEYAEQQVASENLESFLELLNYEKLEPALKKSHTVEIRYRVRASEDLIRVKVLPAKDYSESSKNTLWMFEHCYDAEDLK